MGFSKFISEDEDPYAVDPYAQYERDDWSGTVAPGQKGQQLWGLDPNEDDGRHGRRRRSGGGGGDENKMLNVITDQAVPPGKIKDAAAASKFVDAAGTQSQDRFDERMDAVNDREADMNRAENEYMFKTSGGAVNAPDQDKSMTKPAGPDSPSVNYKNPSGASGEDPADKYLSDYKQGMKAWEDKYSKRKSFWSMQTTKDWKNERDYEYQRLQQERQGALGAYGRAVGAQPHPIGGAQKANGAEGPGLYVTYSDGTTKKVAGLLDHDAESDKYEPGTMTVGDRYYARMLKGTNKAEPVMGSAFLSSDNPIRDYGPVAPDQQVPMRKWVEPKNNPDSVMPVGEGQDVIEKQPDGSYKRVYTGRAKTFSQNSGKSADEETMAIMKEAMAYASRVVEKEKENKARKPLSDPAAEKAWWKARRDEEIDLYLEGLGFTREKPAKGSEGKDKPFRIKIDKPRPGQ